MVTDLQPGSLDSNPRFFIVVKDTLFFSAGSGLWTSDGTPTGTIIFYSCKSYTFFTADDGIHGRELWKSDGTEAGTVLVKDIYPGTGGWAPEYLTAFSNMLFFNADDSVHGRELWALSVQPCSIGDMNCDNTVNIFDLQRLINCIFGTGVCDYGDLNSDGNYNIFDIQQLINKIFE